MTERFDAIVVGAGPAGSASALVMARSGMKVLLLERGEYPGAKNVSGAVFYGSTILYDLIPNWPERAPLQRMVKERRVAFLTAKTSFALDYRTNSYSDPSHYGFTVLRPSFDRWLASEAEAAGAILLCEAVVDDVLWKFDRVAGVRVRRDRGEVHANIVIACDGVNSLLAKKTGLQRPLEARAISLGVKEIIALDEATIEERFHLTGNEGMAIEYLGSVTGSARGGAFLYTNRDSLSLGVITQLSSLAHQKERPEELLERFKAHPSVAPLVRGGRLREYSAHLIPEAGWKMIPRLYSDGLLVAGDAAGFCFATGLYLEGINYALKSGIASGEAAIAAHRAGDFSARKLSCYHDFLEARHVLSDFRRYQHAPKFVNDERVQSLYPALLAHSMEGIFRVDGGPKRKIVPLVLESLRHLKVSPWHLLKDLLEAGRALVW